MDRYRFASCLAFAYLSWTVWCLLMVGVGAPFDLPLPRALFRFAAVVVPALAWIYSSEPKALQRLRFTTNWRSGLAVGAVVAMGWAALHATQNLQLPTTAHAWINVVILSPIAEEILFRCVVIDRLLTWTSASKAIALSAVLFSLFHLPWWWISGEMATVDLIQLLGLMFVYGMVFGVLYYRTRSIWASLLPHSMNNLIAESLVRG
jgi:membrane protease YdiL (CAAX protease family)